MCARYVLVYTQQTHHEIRHTENLYRAMNSLHTNTQPSKSVSRCWGVFDASCWRQSGFQLRSRHGNRMGINCWRSLQKLLLLMLCLRKLVPVSRSRLNVLQHQRRDTQHKIVADLFTFCAHCLCEVMRAPCATPRDTAEFSTQLTTPPSPMHTRCGCDM